MKLTCPRCSASITSKQIDIKDTSAHCTKCNFLFDFIGEIYTHRLSKNKAKKIELSPSELVFFAQPNKGSFVCAECKAEIPQRNINHREMLATCSACDHLLDFSAERHAFKVAKGKFPDEILEVKGLEFLDFDDELFFRYRPNTVTYGSIVFLIILIAVGALFILFQTSLPVILGILLAELILVYSLLSFFLNSKMIHVDENHITIKTVPLNVGQNSKISREEVFQLYTHMYQQSESETGTPIYRYALSITNQRGRQKNLTKGFIKPEIPLFVESKVEKFWVIKDVPVHGELE